MNWTKSANGAQIRQHSNVRARAKETAKPNHELNFFQRTNIMMADKQYYCRWIYSFTVVCAYAYDCLYGCGVCVCLCLCSLRAFSVSLRYLSNRVDCGTRCEAEMHTEDTWEKKKKSIALCFRIRQLWMARECYLEKRMVFNIWFVFWLEFWAGATAKQK